MFCSWNVLSQIIGYANFYILYLIHTLYTLFKSLAQETLNFRFNIARFALTMYNGRLIKRFLVDKEFTFFCITVQFCRKQNNIKFDNQQSFMYTWYRPNISSSVRFLFKFYDHLQCHNFSLLSTIWQPLAIMSLVFFLLQNVITWPNKSYYEISAIYNTFKH